LCKTIPEYNLIGSVLRRMQPTSTSWWLKCATKIGFSEEIFYCGSGRHDLYGTVIAFFVIDLVKIREVEGLDLSTYRSFSKGKTNWAIGDDLLRECKPETRTMIKGTLRASFDRSVLIWHIATDLCFRRLLPQDWLWSRRLSKKQLDELSEDQQRLRQLCTQAISNYMAHLLNFRADMLMTGSRQHLFDRASKHMESSLAAATDMIRQKLHRNQQLDDDDLRRIKIEAAKIEVADVSVKIYSLIYDACKLAEELIRIRDDGIRSRLMYRVWVGMLSYSASMCRGYLHAKSLGEGGEFLSVIWLILSLKGARTLADKLQMPEPEDDDDV
jgi:hypothetical protein